MTHLKEQFREAGEDVVLSRLGAAASRRIIQQPLSERPARVQPLRRAERRLVVLKRVLDLLASSRLHPCSSHRYCSAAGFCWLTTRHPQISRNQYVG